MTQSNVMAADASYSYIAAERGQKGGNQGGNREGNRDREGSGREKEEDKKDKKSNQDRKNTPETERRGGGQQGQGDTRNR